MKVEELRPVEALWLLNREGEQRWDREGSLRAVLIDLATRGLLEPEEDDDTFEPTGQEPDVELRVYEEQILEAIEGEDDQQRMVEAVYEFDFNQFFVDKGLLKEDTNNKSIELFGYTLYSWTETEIVGTQKYDRILSELRSDEEELRSDVRDESLRADEVPMVYAFQYSDWFSEFDEKDVEETVVNPDDVEVDVSTSSAVDNTYVATNAATIAATSAASATCASSAASACAAGGAAGAAGAC